MAQRITLKERDRLLAELMARAHHAASYQGLSGSAASIIRHTHLGALAARARMLRGAPQGYEPSRGAPHL